MKNQVFVLMRRSYRWTKQGNLMNPSADPVIGVWQNQTGARRRAEALAVEELEKLPKDCEVKFELKPDLGLERIFIMLDNRPYCVYDILQYEVRL